MQGWTDLVPRTALRAALAFLWLVPSGILGFLANSTSAHVSMASLSTALMLGAAIWWGCGICTYAVMQDHGYIPATQRARREARREARTTRQEERRARRRAYRARKESGVTNAVARLHRIEAAERELGIDIAQEEK